MKRPMDERKYEALVQEMQDRVRAEIAGRCEVIYAAYPIGEDGLPVNHLEEVAVRGRVQAVDEIWDSYIGEVLENPTWLQLAVEANRMILASEDFHHVAFENVQEMGRTEDGVIMLSLGLGS